MADPRDISKRVSYFQKESLKDESKLSTVTLLYFQSAFSGVSFRIMFPFLNSAICSFVL